MIWHEARKLLHQRVTVVLLFLLLLINGVVVWRMDIPGIEPYSQMDVTHILSLYKALPEDGEVALSALEEQKEVLTQAIWDGSDPGGYLTEDIYSERQLFQTVIDRIEPAVNYSSTLQEIDFNAETLLLTGRYEEDTFEYRNVVTSRQSYQKLRTVEPEILYTGSVELLPGGGITEIMAVLMGMMIGLELVFSEREKGTLALCKATYKGGVPLICGKILAGLLVGTAGTILLYGSNLLIGLIKCGGVELSAPIQSIFGMTRCVWNVSIGEYLCLFFGFKILWTGAVMAVAYVASYVGKRLWQCCGLFLLIGGLCFLRPGSVLNPYGMGKWTELFGNYWNLNVFGYPVSNLSASVVALSLILVCGFCLTIFLHVKKAPTIGEGNATQKERKLPAPRSLLSYEGRKMLIINGGAYVLIVLMVVQIFVYARFPNWISPQEQLYIHYSEILAGVADGEKDAFIAQEEERFKALYLKLEEYDNALETSAISQDSYASLTGDVYRQLESEATFQRARDQYVFMKEKGLEYVCLTPYDRLLGREGIREILRQSMFLVIALVAGLSGVFATEHETGMIFLLRTTARERDSERKKGLLVVIYGLVGAVLVYVPQILGIWISYGLPGLSAPAGSVPVLAMEFGTVGTVIGVYGALLGAISVGISLGITLLSKWTRNTIHTCLYGYTLLLTPLSFGLILL